MSSKIEELTQLKDKGNELFKQSLCAEAIAVYSEAADGASKLQSAEGRALHAVILANRALCYLKTQQYEQCIQDCSSALELEGANVKALYRRAQAYEALAQYPQAFTDLKLLLQIKSDKAALDAIRRVKQRMEQETVAKTPIARALTALKEGENVSETLRAMVGMCLDDTSHAMDLGRKQGITFLLFFIQEKLQHEEYDSAAVALRVLTACVSHMPFVRAFVKVPGANIPSSPEFVELSFVCDLVGKYAHTDLSLAAITFMLRIIKALPAEDPASLTSMVVLDQEQEEEQEETKSSSTKPQDRFILALKHEAAAGILEAWKRGLHHSEWVVQEAAIDSIIAFCSEHEDYNTAQKPAEDLRNETLEQRKSRLRHARLIKFRQVQHVHWLLEHGLLDALVMRMSAATVNQRQKLSVAIGKLCIALDNDDELKTHLQRYIDASVQPDKFDLPACKLRAALEAALLLSRADLGVWALGQQGGVHQLLALIGYADTPAQELATEVLCLAASSDNGRGLLGPALETGALHNLLQVPSASVRAAAAATIAKLSISAKALRQASPETTQLLNVVTDVLRNTSAADLAVANPKDGSNSSGGMALTSADRAIEVLSCLIGKSYVKEEVTHGSNRVVGTLKTLCDLSIDGSHHSAYGLAYIFANLTVTLQELRKRAFKDKEITPEQYDELQRLTRVQLEQQGDEKKLQELDAQEEEDADTPEQCRARIIKLANDGGIRALTRLAKNASDKTKSTCMEALCQMAVVDSVRGLMLQQGAMKTSIDVAMDEKNSTECRINAAHTIGKLLVTTDPSLLTEAQRMGSIKPMIWLCRQPNVANLAQFECLLALTNLASFSPATTERICSENGVHAIHYLMFSDHEAVRRAATEALCNMATIEDVLKLMRTDRVKLWLGFAEEFDNVDDNPEALATARAAAATLAMAAADEEVAKSMLTEEINALRTIMPLLESGNPDLVHRVLFWIANLLSHESTLALGSRKLIQSGAVQALAVVGATPGIGDNGTIMKLASDVVQLLQGGARK